MKHRLISNPIPRNEGERPIESSATAPGSREDHKCLCHNFSIILLHTPTAGPEPEQDSGKDTVPERFDSLSREERLKRTTRIGLANERPLRGGLK